MPHIRTGLDVRNGHHLVGEYLARWWKCSGQWQWEVVDVKYENHLFEIDVDRDTYSDSDFTVKSDYEDRSSNWDFEHDGQYHHSNIWGSEKHHCDARAKAIGHAHVLTVKLGKTVLVKVENLGPDLHKLKSAVVEFCRKADIET